MSEVESGGNAVEVATPVKEDNYVVHSETVAQEAAVESAQKQETPAEADTQVEADDGETPDSSEQAPKKKGGFQRKIDNLKAENEAFRRKIAELQGMAQPPSQQVEKAPQSPDGPPLEANYENVLDWMVALNEWKLDQKLNAREEAAEYQKNSVSFEQRAQEFAEEVPDFVDKIQALNSSGLIKPEIEKAVLKSSMSEKIAYHLANYPSDLLIMQNLGKKELDIAVSKIEEFISTTPKEDTAVRQTRAAAPITPVKPTASTTTKSLDSMDFEEYKKTRSKK